MPDLGIWFLNLGTPNDWKDYVIHGAPFTTPADLEKCAHFGCALHRRHSVDIIRSTKRHRQKQLFNAVAQDARNKHEKTMCATCCLSPTRTLLDLTLLVHHLKRAETGQVGNEAQTCHTKDYSDYSFELENDLQKICGTNSLQIFRLFSSTKL